MTDHIIKAAKEAGFDWTDLGVQDRLAFARFYAIAFAAGMERAAEICGEVIEHPAGHNGQWEGYGPVIAQRDGKACAAAIRAHAQNQPIATHKEGA